MEFSGYCVRVQAYDGYGDKIQALRHLTDYESIISIKHVGSSKENPHYHFVIKTNVKDQAFRVRMKKVFDQGKGNEHMSIKAWDGNIDAVSYLFHEDPDGPVHSRHNVSDETIEKARQRNKEVSVKIEQAKGRASWRIEDEVFTIYHTNETLPRTEHDIAHSIILFALRHDKYVPNDFLLKGMASKIQFRLLANNEADEDLFAQRYVSRAYRMDLDQERLWMDRRGGRG